MVFSTPIFMFFFLPLVLCFYYLFPLKWKNLVLLLASLLFYFWGEQEYVLIMVVSTIIDYVHGLLVVHYKNKGNIKRGKLVVVSSIVWNLSILFFFKYWDFFATTLRSIGIDWMPVLGIALPVGISFYTFQTMSYTIDVYRGDAKPQRNILHFGAYVAMFPQLIAGPIVKYKDVDKQLVNRKHSIEMFSLGAGRFVIGLSKKLLLANTIGQFWDTYQNLAPESRTVAGAWLGIIAFALQIYFDFSGYSDMAIGLGRMFGFEFMENFNYPYIAKSITEFWRRWHISLSTWFRTYLYIPLGGNRCKKSRWVWNLLLVWLATGIWHGANWNFLAWGFYFFVLLLVEKCYLGSVIDRLPDWIGHLYAMVGILISWVIFAMEDISALGGYLAAMFGIGVKFWDVTTGYYLANYGCLMLIGAVGATPFISRLFLRLPEKTRMPISVVLFVLGLLLCTAYMIADSYNPFLYFRF